MLTLHARHSSTATVTVRVMSERPAVRAGLEALVRGTHTVVDDVRVDVVLADVDGLAPRALAEVLAGGTRVLLVTDRTDGIVADAMRAGALGCVGLRSDGPTLAHAVARVAAGEIVLDPAVATQLALRAVGRGEHRWPGAQLGLSRREGEVLCLLAEGLSNGDIAERLCLGHETIKTHLRSIYRKLGVRDRSQAAVTAVRSGVVA